MKHRKTGWCILFVFAALAAGAALLAGQDILRSLGRAQDFASKRISSYDRTGGNKDSLTVEAGATAVLADLKGPGAIHHIWVTIAAEAFYGRKLVLRAYWDGEATPSVEAPIGDFFGVGHGLNRNISSLPIACSSEGRARNCYWYMPFARSARVTVTNEGSQPVDAFYYYIDYRELPGFPADTTTFHAQYRQEIPCEPGHNYLILEAAGRGHYVGCNLSVLQQAMGWWGEGDDMMYVDGEAEPSLHGTGSEDYFSDAWGMREGENLFYGCPLQEQDFQAGSKATVYRFHIPDPVAFRKSIRVTIEHGHANDRADYYSSVAYWYQTEPHHPFPSLPAEGQRLPYALAFPDNFILPAWQKGDVETGSLFEDGKKGLAFWAGRLAKFDSPFYGADGSRYPVLLTEAAKSGDKVELSFPVEIPDKYDLDLYFLKGLGQGNVRAVSVQNARAKMELSVALFTGYASVKDVGKLSLQNLALPAGTSKLTLEIAGKDAASSAMDLGFIGLALSPRAPKYITEWNLIGPFDAPDLTFLTTVYPPEKELVLNKSYRGKNGAEVKWSRLRAEDSGYMRLDDRIKPNEQAIIYGLVFVYAPEETDTFLLVGSDDGVRVWLNGSLVHSNAAYRAAVPDEDRVRVHLKQGWNACLLKDIQGAGGWGFFLRFADPEGKLRWSVEPPPAK
jgi:hypothetical protein